MAKKSSPERKAKFSARFAITEANKRRKVKKHARNNPNDKQAAAKAAGL